MVAASKTKQKQSPAAKPKRAPKPKPVANKSREEFAEELRSDVIAIELNHRLMGHSRSMNVRHKDEVAEHFGAEKKAVGGSKKLYDPKQAEIKKILSLQSDARRVWLELTIAYRKGVRLLRKEALPKWIKEFDKIRDKLELACHEADANYELILKNSRKFLGEKLFNEADYPSRFVGSVSVTWSTYNFEPSQDLMHLAPETYKREQERVRKQFESAVSAFEQEAREQLLQLISSLTSKLKASANGEKVKFREAAIVNLRDFFDRFSTLNIRSDVTLNQLVDQAKLAVGNTTMTDLKRNEDRREGMAKKLTAIEEQLDKLVTAAPVRSIDLDDLE